MGALVLASLSHTATTLPRHGLWSTPEGVSAKRDLHCISRVINFALA